MKEYEQVNYKLPAEIVAALREKAKAEKKTATELVLQGLRHVLGMPEGQQANHLESSIQESIRFIEERLRQLEARDIENQLYPRLARLEMLINSDEESGIYNDLAKRIETIESKDSNIDRNIEVEINRLASQTDRLDKVLIRNTIEIQSAEQRVLQRLTALEKRLKSLEEPQNKTEQLEAIFEEEAPLIELIKNLPEKIDAKEATSEKHISPQADEQAQSLPKNNATEQKTLIEEKLTHNELADRTGINIGNIRSRYARKREVFHNGVTYRPGKDKGKPKWISQISNHSPQLLTEPEVNQTSTKNQESNQERTHDQISELTGMNIEAVRSRHRFERPIKWNGSKFIPVRVEGKPRWIEQTKERENSL
jgi:hypothetical protein